MARRASDINGAIHQSSYDVSVLPLSVLRTARTAVRIVTLVDAEAAHTHHFRRSETEEERRLVDVREPLSAPPGQQPTSPVPIIAPRDATPPTFKVSAPLGGRLPQDEAEERK